MERSSTTTAPKDAAAVILIRQDTDPSNPEVFWVKRSDKLAFLGGFRVLAVAAREELVIAEGVRRVLS